MSVSYEEDLKGRSIIDATGRHIGAVEGLTIDTQTWRVDGVRAKLRRDAAEQIGLPHRTFRSDVLELPISLVHAAGDAVILNVPVAALRDLVTADGAGVGA